jgi:hypothetical protein
MMVMVSLPRAVPILVALLAAIAPPARADERAQLNACKALTYKALVERAERSQPANATPDDAELQRCRQIIREWTLRDARMSVDENGRPLR